MKFSLTEYQSILKLASSEPLRNAPSPSPRLKKRNTQVSDRGYFDIESNSLRHDEYLSLQLQCNLENWSSDCLSYSLRGTYICAHAWIFLKLCTLITQDIQTMKLYLLN